MTRMAADLATAAVGLLVAQHFDSPLLYNPHELTAALFLQQPRILVVGTLALFADTILIVLVYELVAHYVTASLFLRIALSLVAVLVFDTVLFATGSFVESPAYRSILLSDMLGKVVAELVYAALLAVYLRYFDVADDAPPGARPALGNLFQVLTYREKYEVLQARALRDPLTGIYNRGFFDETLAALAARSIRAGTPLTLLMLDIDHCKQLNDTYGHRAGDQALQAVASVLAASTRAADVVCRYGGEEFAVLLPDTDLPEGARLAERIAGELTARLRAQGARWSERPVTATIGLACMPAEAATGEDLVQLADRRLYAGKAHGRNCVVAGDLDAADATIAAAQVEAAQA